jgi:hypothetical protein
MPAASPTLILADVRMPRRFRHVNTSATTIAQAQYGTAGANTCACWLIQIKQIIGFSM